ncbi:uncharacterized protein LOC116343669 [Contarinia nasturtii]|uniref:uncharacterized protein LOC116343669 n=1 Tax=Contarinia nasturtii TaxID=265458 RepID=UPI0012D3F8BF|nr:uncharacterized protein LOC116343669 [Contarinia nasturtii]
MNFIRSTDRLVLMVLIIGPAFAQSPVGDVVGKLVVGYQGWFATPFDGSPRRSWVHWTIRSGPNGSTPPSTGNCKFELYPDVREYLQLYQTGLAALGNGQPANLFSSWNQLTVNTHFSWMQTYNIDTAALQRFGSDLVFPLAAQQMNGVAFNVQRAAETYGRKFFVMYDLSGWTNFTTQLMPDFNSTVINLMQSPAYARQNGKPVICIWGIGFGEPGGNRPNNPTGTQNIINQLKTNYYVMCGVPHTWRTNDGISLPAYASVYRSCNMIQPWTVGTYGTIETAKLYATREGADLQECRNLGIDYQPVVFPGFAWSNWNGGPRNVIPRNNGTFMWQQFKNIRSLQCPNVYVAMFDEYDEGTAIAKAAETKQMAPRDQYFLTLDEDRGRLSSDFYLRLVRDGMALIRGQFPLTDASIPPTSQQATTSGQLTTTSSQFMSAFARMMPPNAVSMLQSVFAIVGLA